jgi:hypothetical protein
MLGFVLAAGLLLVLLAACTASSVHRARQLY